jgi:hypothetical protein
MALILDGNGLIQGLDAGGLPSGSVNADTLASTLDLSSKTMTFGNVSASGITFPATQSASGNANTLDDYEEGDFTPSLTFSSGSVTYGTQEGAYTKIGRLVNVTMAFAITGLSSPSGDVGISGLPFTNGSGQKFVSGASFGLIRSLTISNAFFRAYISTGSTTMVIASNATNTTGEALQGNQLTTSTLIYLSLTYQTT